MKINDTVELYVSETRITGSLAANMAEGTDNWIVILNTPYHKPGSVYHGHRAMIISEQRMQVICER